MSADKDGSSGFRRKYLYMDRFVAHQEEDSKWKKQSSTTLKKIKDKVDNLVWFVLLGSCLALAALLVSVMH